MIYNVLLFFLLCPIAIHAHASSDSLVLHATGHPIALICLGIFCIAYLVVIMEEKIDLNKSKPVILAAGLIWTLIACLVQIESLNPAALHHTLDDILSEYGKIMLFLLVAMTYINTINERHVFLALKSYLLKKNFSYRKIFWITGLLAFFSSPIADNMTAALIIGAIIMAVGKDNKRFVALSMINIVVAANAGGAYSPFGDITTLMVWQAQKVDFFNFFSLFLPSLVNFLIPAFILSFMIEKTIPVGEKEDIKIKPGGIFICILFLLTIILTVTFEQILKLPAFLGMMTGLSFLMLYIYVLNQIKHKTSKKKETKEQQVHLDIFHHIAMAEWDTLFFFFGIIFSVAGLSCLGYLTLASNILYNDFGATYANITAGLFSSIIDNIPVMFAILHMNPQMSEFQWLLITLTAGIGGSLLSIGSAAGVALMGTSKGLYTFFSHLKWSWLILISYIASIATHFLFHHYFLK